MNAKKFSNTLGEVNDKYVSEAIQYKAKKKKSVWLKGAIAACLCVALALGIFIKSPTSDEAIGPGFLVITAYAASSDEEMIMQEGIELPLDYNWSLAISSRPGLPLKLSTDEYTNVTFEVSVEDGKLLLWENNKISAMNSPFEVENGTTIYWTNIYQTDNNDVEKYMGTTAYIDIIIREGKNIVGYAVVNIYTNDLENAPTQSYYAKLIKSVSFPKVDGKYQKITSEYVQSEMELIKNAVEDEIVDFHGKTFIKANLSKETLEWLEQYNSLSPEEQRSISFVPSELRTADGGEVNADDYIVFHGKTFLKADLSKETLEWLEWYNSLSQEDQLAISSVPADLYTYDTSGTVEEIAGE